jgi:hypothetical protein
MTAFVADLFEGTGGVSSMSQAFNPGTSNYLRIYVFATQGVSVTSISFGAQTPTLISGSANGDILGVYQLVNPTQSSQTITVNLSGTSARCCFYAVSRSGVNTSTPSGTAVTATDETATSAVTVSSAVGQLVEGFTCVATLLGVTNDGAQTVLENQTDWASTAISSSAAEKAGASSVTLTWTHESGTWFAVAIPILAAEGGTTYTLTAEAGTYAITGSDALRDMEMNGDAGSYALTGFDAGLRFNRRLTAEFGVYTLTGRDATLDYSGETAAPDTGTGSGGVFKIRRALVVSTTGRAKWLNYIPVKQVEGSTPGTYDNNGAVEIELLVSGVGLTEWLDYVPIVEVVDGDSGKWRYDNSGWIPILFVE